MGNRRPVAEDPETAAMIEEAIAEAKTSSSLMWLADRAANFPDPDDFDPDEGPSAFTERQRDVIAAAILYSCDLTTDGLGLDEVDLTRRVSKGEPFDVEDTQVLSELPSQFWSQMDLAFVARFRSALTVVADRFRSQWAMPGNVAEELATRIVLEGAVAQLDVWEVDIPECWVSNLQEVVFEDPDHESLYDAEPVPAEVAKAMGFAPMGFQDLFDAFRDTEPVDY
ncbi:MAG: hypothetical protein HIU88_12665 [Acidobacteria bacterium]|nr:hypothetical protein [Acidobacteriota bacterium]